MLKYKSLAIHTVILLMNTVTHANVIKRSSENDFPVHLSENTGITTVPNENNNGNQKKQETSEFTWSTLGWMSPFKDLFEYFTSDDILGKLTKPEDLEFAPGVSNFETKDILGGDEFKELNEVNLNNAGFYTDIDAQINGLEGFTSDDDVNNNIVSIENDDVEQTNGIKPDGSFVSEPFVEVENDNELASGIENESGIEVDMSGRMLSVDDFEINNGIAEEESDIGTQAMSDMDNDSIKESDTTWINNRVETETRDGVQADDVLEASDEIETKRVLETDTKPINAENDLFESIKTERDTPNQQDTLSEVPRELLNGEIKTSLDDSTNDEYNNEVWTTIKARICHHIPHSLSGLTFPLNFGLSNVAISLSVETDFLISKVKRELCSANKGQINEIPADTTPGAIHTFLPAMDTSRSNIIAFNWLKVPPDLSVVNSDFSRSLLENNIHNTDNLLRHLQTENEITEVEGVFPEARAVDLRQEVDNSIGNSEEDVN